MRQICCVCKILYGIKEPLDNDSETHGFCPECLKIQMKNINDFFDKKLEDEN